MDAALRRIDDGSYGMCGSCGQPIAEERLEALPWTTRCIDCKRREERG
jgi:DnaK suppressor protein